MSTNVADRMQRLGTETAFEVLAEVKKLESQGRQIISFAIGEPDFDTPAHIVEAGVAALRSGETHYGPSAGLPQLRAAIARHVGSTRCLDVGRDNVVVMPGAKPLIFHGVLALVNPGDEVIYPSPGFPIYESVVNFVGATPVPLLLREEREFSFAISDLERLVSDKTKLLILNSPQNPTGGMLEKEDLEAIAQLAQEYDFWVMSDEVYSRIIYEGEFASIASIEGMQERTLIIDGFSKTYAMTGWRLGYGVMPRHLAEHITRLETNCESCTATFTQLAGLAALEGPQEATDAMVAEFRKRRDAIVAGLNALPGFRCLKPRGAFYVFPNVSEACDRHGFAGARELQEYLLYEAGVAVLPRTSFGAKVPGETGEYLRLSYATSMANIEEGLRRMQQAL